MKLDITLPLTKAFINRAAHLGYRVQTASSKVDPDLCMIAYKGLRELCKFELSGQMRYYSNNPLVHERKELHHLLLEIKQAHDLYARAKTLDFDGVTDFHLISEFGDYLLAAKLGKDNEVRFSTWSYDNDRRSVTLGHYYETNYEGAKKDFALRAGLVDENQFFNEDELKVLYAAAVYRGRNDDSLHNEDEKALQSVMDKLEYNLPSLATEQEEQSNETEMGV